MSILYPNQLDNFATIADICALNNKTYHYNRHNDIIDALNALEDRIGIINSSDSDSIEYKVNHLLQTRIQVGMTGSGAKYICDGTDDHVEIQAAIEEANYNGGNWEVEILGGTYNIGVTLEKYRVSIIGTPNTKLQWVGANDGLMFTNINSDYFYMRNITLDGGGSANGVVGMLPGSNTDKITLDRVYFMNFGVGLDTGSVDPFKNFWDSSMYDCYFRNCAIGYKVGEYEFDAYRCMWSYCDIGVQFEVNTNAAFFGGTWTHCGKDIYFNAHPENISFYSVWFEESSDIILEAKAGGGWCKTLAFNGCRFHTRNVSHMMDLTNVAANVKFDTCQFRCSATPAVTSTVVTEGEYSFVTYIHCYEVDSVGATSQRGKTKFFNEVNVDHINEQTLNHGVTIEGNNFKDNEAYLPYCNVQYAIRTNDIYKLADAAINIHNITAFAEMVFMNGGAVLSSLAIDTMSEKTENAGVTIEGVQLIDDTIKGIGAIKAGPDQATATAEAGEIWRTSGHATLPDNIVMIGV